MGDLITDEIRAWIGRSQSFGPIDVSRQDIVKYSLATEQRLERFLRGDAAPLMFLFGAIRPIVPLDELSTDGLAADPLVPELPLTRTMAGGSRIQVHRPVRPGDVLFATRTLTDIYEKAGRSGPLIFVHYELAVSTEGGERIMDETQTRIAR